MINWLWIIPAIMLGGMLAVAFLALCSAAKDEKDETN